MLSTEIEYYQEIWNIKKKKKKLCGMRTNPLLPSLPSSLWPGVVAPDKSPISGSNRSLTFKLCTYAKLNCLK